MCFVNSVCVQSTIFLAILRRKEGRTAICTSGLTVFAFAEERWRVFVIIMFTCPWAAILREPGLIFPVMHAVNDPWLPVGHVHELAFRANYFCSLVHWVQIKSAPADCEMQANICHSFVSRLLGAFVISLFYHHLHSLSHAFYARSIGLRLSQTKITKIIYTLEPHSWLWAVFQVCRKHILIADEIGIGEELKKIGFVDCTGMKVP